MSSWRVVDSVTPQAGLAVGKHDGGIPSPAVNFIELARRRYVPTAIAVLGIATVASMFLPDNLKRPAQWGAYVVFGVIFVWGYTARPSVPNPEGLPAGQITIAEHLRRGTTRYTQILVPLIVAWIAGVVFYGGSLPKPYYYGLVCGGSVGISLLGALFMRKGLHCPRCGCNFRKERIAKLGRFNMDARGTADLWDRCPQCGVSFSDPYTP